MAGYAPGDSSHNRMEKNGQLNSSQEELHNYGSRWYFSRKVIEENSPSRRNGIDLKKETYFRKTYCTFLQDLGMRLKVPQVTIATAIVFCHRFFLRQSHSKSDRMTIATVCMFLAGKVEETPRPLKDVILISYEIIHKRDPSAVQRIKQKEVYEQQKELVLFGERLVLATLGFDLNLLHPYKPLVEAIKKFKVAQNALAQVAWNFVNDGLRTSLFLQFMPHQIAAGAIFLAAKFLKVKLPSDGEKVWWQEFDVTPRQLEDVSNQMLELYEQNRVTQPSSHGNEAESSSGAGAVNRSEASSTVCKNSAPVNATEGVQIHQNRLFGTQPMNVDGNYFGSQQQQNYSNEHGSADNKSNAWDHSRDGDGKDGGNYKVGPVSHFRETTVEGLNLLKSSSVGGLIGENGNAVEAITKINKDKVKAALEKRRKLRNVAAKNDVIVDEDDLIERELESGIELAVEDKMRQEEKESWPKPLHRLDQPSSQGKLKPKSFGTEDAEFDDKGHEENTEEGELSSLDEHDHSFPKMQSCNGKVSGVRRRPDEKGRSDYSERDLKRMR